MPSQIIYQCVAVLFLVLAPLVNSTAIEIDTFEDLGPDGTIVNSRVVDGVTISMSNEAAVNMIALSYAPYVDDPAYESFLNSGVMNQAANPANVSGQRFISTFARNQDNQLGSLNNIGIMRFDFSFAVSGFGFTTLDVLEPGNTETNYARMSAYDGMGNLLDFMQLNGAQGVDGLDIDWLVSSAMGDIAYVEFSANIYNAAYGIDDMLVNNISVSESASLALLVFGLICVGFVSKHKTA